ncbi:hypothetical protein BRADI_3g47298v3 [Brachypodium distachyon]|uniref:Uncharacterized protein n=1 Tax=Brachypodium distachyon TaxID=15368 RepID=A0A0Q3FKC6_BRADI|nr:hypothetical protein BRADI_3g47298v3 [Brachypodium distachyon]
MVCRRSISSIATLTRYSTTTASCLYYTLKKTDSSSKAWRPRVTLCWLSCLPLLCSSLRLNKPRPRRRRRPKVAYSHRTSTTAAATGAMEAAVAMEAAAGVTSAVLTMEAAATAVVPTRSRIRSATELQGGHRPARCMHYVL